jgi:hypothetical protein
MGYHPPPPIDMKGVTDPLERVARFTYGWYSSMNMNVPSGEKSAVGGQPYLNWANEYKLDGILLHPLLTCRTATFWLTHAGNVAMEHARVPSLSVEGDIVDLTVFNEAQALSQAEAFEETMEHYREVRKKEGLGW